MPETSSEFRKCDRDQVNHVRQFISYAKRIVNEKSYYPPAYGYQYLVALALYSKCLTVAEATLHLLDAGFSDEAFGLTRTLVDIFITLRYIANKDTDERAKRYAQFAAKNSVEWNKVVGRYWPERMQTLDERTLIAAAIYKNPHQWSGESAKTMALEPDSIEVDPATQQPVDHNVAYYILYRWTSHFVHPTIDALRNHLVQAGNDPFVVHSRQVQDMSHMAVFNVATSVANALIPFYRCMGDPQPDRLSKWAAALITHIARRHR